MSLKPKDPLLTVACLLLWFLIGCLVVAVILFAYDLTLGLIPAGGSSMLSEVRAAGLGYGSYWGSMAALFAMVVQTSLWMCFTLKMKGIATSVREGSPFVAKNAKRLAHMGWLLLAYKLIDIPARLAIAVLDETLAVTGREVNLAGVVASGGIRGPELGGIALILSLFILARVFRVGLEQRQDLEGTV